MRPLAAVGFAIAAVFAPGAGAADFWHPAPAGEGSFWHPAPAPAGEGNFWHPAPRPVPPVMQNGVHPGVHPVVRNPLWRSPVRAVNQSRFRFRGHTFVVIGAPLYAAPWLSYPYALGSPWGPSYYIPGEQGYFLYYCADPAGYYPEVQNCPGGWWQTVPDEPQPQEMDPSY
jgi:hypothetical protein